MTTPTSPSPRRAALTTDVPDRRATRVALPGRHPPLTKRTCVGLGVAAGGEAGGEAELLNPPARARTTDSVRTAERGRNVRSSQIGYVSCDIVLGKRDGCQRKVV